MVIKHEREKAVGILHMEIIIGIDRRTLENNEMEKNGESITKQYIAITTRGPKLGFFYHLGVLFRKSNSKEEFSKNGCHR